MARHALYDNRFGGFTFYSAGFVIVSLCFSLSVLNLQIADYRAYNLLALSFFQFPFFLCSTFDPCKQVFFLCLAPLSQNSSFGRQHRNRSVQ